jgi:hypothetical protein
MIGRRVFLACFAAAVADQAEVDVLQPSLMDGYAVVTRCTGGWPSNISA